MQMPASRPPAFSWTGTCPRPGTRGTRKIHRFGSCLIKRSLPDNLNCLCTPHSFLRDSLPPSILLFSRPGCLSQSLQPAESSWESGETSGLIGILIPVLLPHHGPRLRLPAGVEDNGEAHLVPHLATISTWVAQCGPKEGWWQVSFASKATKILLQIGLSEIHFVLLWTSQKRRWLKKVASRFFTTPYHTSQRCACRACRYTSCRVRLAICEEKSVEKTQGSIRERKEQWGLWANKTLSLTLSVHHHLVVTGRDWDTPKLKHQIC